MNLIKSRLSAGSFKLLLIPLFLVLIIVGCKKVHEYIIPNKPPYVEIVLPVDSVFSTGDTITFRVKAYDDDGSVDRVVFRQADSQDSADFAGADKSGLYEYAWHTGELVQGIYMVTIKAVDNKDEVYVVTDTITLVEVFAGKDIILNDSLTFCTLNAVKPASGGGSWSIVSGNGGQFSDIHDANAIFTGLPCETYVLRWTAYSGSRMLFDEIAVTFSHQPSQADAGPDQQITDGHTSTVMQAVRPVQGTGSWKVAAGIQGGAFDYPANPHATFTGLPLINYKLVWSVSTQCAMSSDTVNVFFNRILINANAGADQSYADARTTTLLTAEVPVIGTGTWSIIDGIGGVISDIHDPAARLTGIPCQSYLLRWTVTFENQELSDEVRITFFYKPSQAKAGSDQLITDARTTVSLQANAPSDGTGRWSVLSGNSGSFSDPALPNAAFTGLPCNTYSLVWTVSTPCMSSSDTVQIRFDQLSVKANAGPDQAFTDGRVTATLAANNQGNATGTWTIISGLNGRLSDAKDPVAVLTGQSCQTYILRWTIATPCSSSSDEVTITFNHVPVKANAGPDQSYSDGRVTAVLAANSQETATGTWTIVSGPNGGLSDAKNPRAVLTGQLCQTYILRWTIATPCSSTFDEVAIIFNHVPGIANAGPDQSFYDGRSVVNLNATPPAGGTGLWKIASGGTGSFNNATLPNAVFTGVPCTNYQLVWTVSTVCSSSSDTVKIQLGQTSFEVNAGADQVFTDGRSTATLAGNTPAVGLGTWTVTSGAGGQFAAPNNPGSVFTGRLCQNYVLRWTIVTPCGTKYDEVLITFNHLPTNANAGPDMTTNGPVTTVVLAANTPVQGSGLWSVVSGSNGIFEDARKPNSRFSGESCQKYTLKWTIGTLCGTSSDQVDVSFTDLPSESNAGVDQHLYDGSAGTQLNATPPVNGTGLWSIVSGGTGAFSNTSDPRAFFNGTLCRSYTLRWTVSTACSSSFDEVDIAFNQVSLVADAGQDIRISDGSLTAVLQGNIPGAGMTGTWSVTKGQGGAFGNIYDPHTTFTGMLGQIYSLKWSLSGGCIENADIVFVAFISNLDMFDPRDGKTYQAIIIGNQTWMAENLNYSVTGSHSYNDDSNTASIYGRLYDWNTAVAVCPSGWHLPADPEWRQLESVLGMDAATSILEWYRGSTEGGMLKAGGTQYWQSPNAGATDISGFTALPGGYRTPSGIFGGLSTHAGFWTSTGNATGKAIYRALHKDKAQIGRDWYDKGYGFSIRCVKN